MRGGPQPAFRPTWTTHEDFLVITLWPQAAKNLLAALDGGTAGLDRHPDFAKVSQRLQDVPLAQSTSVAYVDLPYLAACLLDNATPVLQSMWPKSRQIPIDAADWPRTEVVTQHLFGLVSTSRTEGRRVYSEVYSPTGYMAPVVGLTGLWTAGMWFRMNSGSGSMPVPEEF
jgi:hypothetical protein